MPSFHVDPGKFVDYFFEDELVEVDGVAVPQPQPQPPRQTFTWLTLGNAPQIQIGAAPNNNQVEGEDQNNAVRVQDQNNEVQPEDQEDQNNEVQVQAPQEPELEAPQAIGNDIGLNENDQEIIEQFLTQIETVPTDTGLDSEFIRRFTRSQTNNS